MNELNNAELFMKLYENLDEDEKSLVLIELESRLAVLGFFPKPVVDYTYLQQKFKSKWFEFALSEPEDNETESDSVLLIKFIFGKQGYSVPFIRRMGVEAMVEREFSLYKKSSNLDGRSKKSMIAELHKILKDI